MKRTSVTKKIGAFLLSLLLVISSSFVALPPMVAIAEDAPVATLNGEDIYVDAGETGVEMDISIADCPTFYGMRLDIHYDYSAFTLTEIKRGPATSLEGGANFSGNPKVVDEEFGRVMIYGLLEFEDEGYYSCYTTASNDVLFTLVFDVNENTKSGEYEVTITEEGFIDPYESPLGMVIGDNGLVGTLGVTGLYVAEVEDEQFEYLSDALASAITLSPATITMLANTIVEDTSDRIVIPNNAEITLDMNGHTITSELAGGTTAGSSAVDVQMGAVLNLVDSSEEKGGGFTHSTGATNTLFLVNSGTLDMSDIAVRNFHNGIKDGSTFTGGTVGTYGTISGCLFEIPNGVALDLKAATVEVIVDTEISTDNLAIRIGASPDLGQIDLLKGCKITGSPGWYLMEISKGGTVTKFEDCYIEAYCYVSAAIKSSGYIGTIDGGTYKVADGYTVHNYLGTIDTITSGYFEGSNCAIHNQQATINEISGGTFVCINSGEGVILNEYPAASIGTISGGEFYSETGSVLRNDGGTIGNITGGYFHSVKGTPFNDLGGVVGSISDGIFHGQESNALYLGITTSWSGADPAELTSISGGTFISDDSSAVLVKGEGTVIEEINGGVFIGGGDAALRLRGGSIENIDDGVFLGGGAAVLLDGTVYECVGYEFDDDWNVTYLYDWVDYITHLGYVSGGYFKPLGDEGLIVLGNEECTWESAEGFNFATVPLRPQDIPEGFPDEELIEERTGFYHFGETVDITWMTEKEEEEVIAVDQFIKGDRVYYSHEIPPGPFRGWSDGENVYAPGVELPDATAAATYGAQFAPFPEDYLVSLETEETDINAGEPFTVKVVITSDANEDFYGATVDLSYDSAKVDYLSPQLPDGFGLVTKGNILQIVGARDEGWEMDGNCFDLATLTFKAKSDVNTGEAVFSIGDAIVNQADAVQDQDVPKGEDLTLNLWNLKVTFQAGENVTMDTAVAYVKYDQVGLWTNTAYDTTFEDPSPEANAHYALEDPLWKPAEGVNMSFEEINLIAYTDDATFTANAFPQEFEFTDQTDALLNVTGLKEGKAVYGTDVRFRVKAEAGYIIEEVSFKAGDGDWTDLTADTYDVYTIPGNSITGDIIVKVDYLVKGAASFIGNDEFNSLPEGFKLLMLTAESKLEGAAYEYNGAAMFYSSLYSNPEGGEHVYLYAVGSDVSEEDALVSIQVKAGSSCIELAYNCDVNGDGRVNSTDAVLVYGLYKGLHVEDPGFTKVSLRLRLEADVNGDGEVNTSDAQAILNHIWGF